MEGLRQSCLFMRSTAMVVLFAFVSLLFHPVVYATRSQAVTPPEVSTHSAGHGHFKQTEHAIDETLAQLQQRLDRKQATEKYTERLRGLESDLDRLDVDTEDHFAATEIHLQQHRLSDTILQRHREALAGYRQELSKLRGSLHAISGAATPAELQKRVSAARKYRSERRRHPYRQPLDPEHLPFHLPRSKVRKPRVGADEINAMIPARPVQLASLAMNAGMLAPVVGPQPGDLQTGVDVQITPEIQALAAELGNNPVAIFNWVRNELEFVPIYGSIQGSQMALETKKANAFDTASLLIALLRAAGIPARYVYGTVEIPAELVMNWVGGVETPEAALSLLAQGDIPSEGLIQGGRITHVRMEHVWVEAWVDYYPSRGAVNINGDSWVAMDAGFKQYTYSDGLDVDQAIPFDAGSLVDQLVQGAQVNDVEGWAAGIDQDLLESGLQDYQAQIQTYLDTSGSVATVADMPGGRSVVPVQAAMLAGSLPYHLLVRSDAFASLPDSLRHRFRYALYAGEQDRVLDSPTLVFEESLPALAGKKLTLGFAPATAEDEALIQSYLPTVHADGSPIQPSEWPASLPGYLIRLTPELLVDGVVVQRGGVLTMGDDFIASLGLQEPDQGWQTVDNSIVVGSTVAIDVAGTPASAAQLAALSDRTAATQQTLQQPTGSVETSALVGDLLYGTVLGYFSLLHLFTDIAAKNQGIISYPLPSIGSFQTELNVNRVFGLPVAVSEGGVLMDIDRNASIVVDKSGDRAGRRRFNALIGLVSSLLESRIPEEIFSTPEYTAEGISAAKALMLANRQGQKIFQLNPSNSAAVLPGLVADADVKTDIANAIAAGLQVTVHESPISVGQWSGTGYIITDPETGVGAYRISGGANGGWTDIAGLISPVLSFWKTWDVAAMGNKFSGFSNALGFIGSIVGVLSFAAETWEKCKDLSKKILVMGLMAGFISIIGSTLTALSLTPLGSILFSMVINFTVNNFMKGIRSIVCQ